MTERWPACPAHRELVTLALDPAATDDTLERYATEVPGCAACQQALGADGPGRVVRLPVPMTVPLDARERERQGMIALRDQLGSARTPRPARRPLWPVGLAAALVAAAAAAIAVFTAVEASDPPAPPTLARPAEGVPHAPAPDVVIPPSPPSVAPSDPVRAPRPAPTPAALDDGDAVASVDPADLGEPSLAEVADWPEPPYEDLRGDAPKGMGGRSVRAVQLVLAGHRPAGVGDRVELVVVASTPMEVAVCVTGPERGVVWRGAVPAGRTSLASDGRAVSFAFSAPGAYRFTVGDGPDAAACQAPLHVVDVDVRDAAP